MIKETLMPYLFMIYSCLGINNFFITLIIKKS